MQSGSFPVILHGLVRNFPHLTSVDLALVGNGAIGALIDAGGTVVWCCLPRFDGDPVFGSLLAGESHPERAGIFAIELVGAVRIEQRYATDTPILVTRCYDKKGGGVEITDFCPRFEKDGILFTPTMLVRQVRPIGGTASIVVRVTSAAGYGCTRREHALGANHISYAGDQALRLTTNAPTEAIVDRSPFHIDRTLTFMFGLDEQSGDLTSVGASLLEQTEAHWRFWVRAGGASRVARCGCTCSNHSRAERPRDEWCNHRRDDDIDPGGSEQRAQLGLPVLLATRCVLRRQRAGTRGRDTDD